MEAERNRAGKHMSGLQFDENGNLIVGGQTVASPAAMPAEGQGETPVQPVEQPVQEGPGFFSEAGRAIGGGIRDGLQEMGETIQWAGEGIGNAITGGHDLYYTSEDGFEWLSQDEAMSRNDIPKWQTTDLLGEGGHIDLPEVAENETLGGNMHVGSPSSSLATAWPGGRCR